MRRFALPSVLLALAGCHATTPPAVDRQRLQATPNRPRAHGKRTDRAGDQARPTIRASSSKPPASLPKIDVEADEEDLGEVLTRLALDAKKSFYCVHPDTQDETLSVSFRDISWDEAARVLGRMCIKNVYTYPAGFLLDWGCASWSSPPTWEEVTRGGCPVVVFAPDGSVRQFKSRSP